MMRVHEIKRLLDELPDERVGEDMYVYHPYFNRLFKIEAIDDLENVRPELGQKRVVFVIAKEPV